MYRTGIIRALTPALTGLWLTACSEPPPPPADPLERQLDTRQEVMHQTREVIRYLEAEERLRREQLPHQESESNRLPDKR